MKIFQITRSLFVVLMALSFASCAKSPNATPEGTVKLYLDELAIIKNPEYYKEFKKPAAEKDELKIKRYTLAVKNTEDLIWNDPKVKKSSRRKTLMLAPLMILRYSGYSVTDVKIEAKSAFINTTFQIIGFGKNSESATSLANEEISNPIKFELIKTATGWLIKNIEYK